MSPRVRRQLASLSLMLMLAVAALLAQGSACGVEQRTLAVASEASDCDLVTCPLRSAPAIARLAEERCKACSATIGLPSDDSGHVHLAAVANQTLERPWTVRGAPAARLDASRLSCRSDLPSFAAGARDDSAPNRAPPSA